jgi:hypothetical protein
VSAHDAGAERGPRRDARVPGVERGEAFERVAALHEAQHLHGPEDVGERERGTGQEGPAVREQRLDARDTLAIRARAGESKASLRRLARAAAARLGAAP